MEIPPVSELICRRFSCRTYRSVPIEAATRRRLENYVTSLTKGPLGTPVRFRLVAATEEDRRALRGLGTYGLIRGATGFILGAMGPGEKNLEDWGYRMEEAILFATALGLGTCWLGGSFTKSSFAHKMDLREGETMPAVAAVGYPAERQGALDRLIRRGAGADRRLPWEHLFFEEGFGRPLSPAAAGPYALPLEMVRLAPSASNRQPWRIVRRENDWHFYLKRTPGYGQGLTGLLVVADLQRIDMGIAMGHFERTAQEVHLRGHWEEADPGLPRPDEWTKYLLTWRGRPE